MIELSDIYWLAGILEGEGCFVIGNSSSILLQMSDEDIVRRVATLLKAKVSGPLPVRKNSYKPLFLTQVHGVRAAEWMMTIWPIMGYRRKAKILKCLAYWKSFPVQNKDKEFCKNGHRLSGDNLVVLGPHERRCRECRLLYHRAYRLKRKQLMRLVS